jgi:predicted glycosyltransferase
LLLTGSPSVGAFDLPETLDYIRIPGPGKWSLFESDAGDDPGAPRDVFPLRKAII